jgi:hypothetical protein
MIAGKANRLNFFLKEEDNPKRIFATMVAGKKGSEIMN